MDFSFLFVFDGVGIILSVHHDEIINFLLNSYPYHRLVTNATSSMSNLARLLNY